MTGNQPSAAPGVAQVRLSGQAGDTDVLVAVLERLAASQPPGGVAFEILTRSAAYPNRREPGQRVYLTVRVSLPAVAETGA